MGLDVQYDHALRGLPALASLVRSVVGAGAHDESESVEWKGHIDLSSKADCFLIAKAILALANRDPASATRFFEGHGYVAAGAEPRVLHGVGTADPADYATRVAAYVGGPAGPVWTSELVPVDGVDVLVVTVEPPRPGDRIWPLRRDFSPAGSSARRGTVYVRKPGKSEPADDADIDMLQNRLLALVKQRQHIDLTPQLEVRLDQHERGGRYPRWIELVGPPGLDRLDSIKVEVRDDWRDRTLRTAGDLTAEDIARQVWSPLRFVPRVDGADDSGRSPSSFPLSLGDVHRSLMCRTTKPPWAPMTDDDWWNDQYANEPTRLRLTCSRGDDEWVVPHKLPALKRPRIRHVDSYVEPR